MPKKTKKKPGSLRPLKIETGVNIHAEGSALISMGNTKVICTATVEKSVPRFLLGKNSGWVSAEYSMLPRSTNTRSRRESMSGRPGGRTMEIQRLIARALRGAVDLTKLGEHSIYIDCDVIQADGGTRTASITGGFVALYLALEWMKKEELIKKIPLIDHIAAVSVGIHNGKPILDLNYEEDSSAETDMNVVMTGKGKFVEVQGTAEEGSFDKKELDQLLALAAKGIKQLVKAQKTAIKNA